MSFDSMTDLRVPSSPSNGSNLRVRTSSVCPCHTAECDQRRVFPGLETDVSWPSERQPCASGLPLRNISIDSTARRRLGSGTRSIAISEKHRISLLMAESEAICGPRSARLSSLNASEGGVDGVASEPVEGYDANSPSSNRSKGYSVRFDGCALALAEVGEQRGKGPLRPWCAIRSKGATTRGGRLPLTTWYPISTELGAGLTEVVGSCK
jgi:hypothetical protein